MNAKSTKKRKKQSTGGVAEQDRGKANRQSKDETNPRSQVANPEALGYGREAVESIVVAIILALLFRAFEAEAFVIPTGSMAPTLLGRNRDIECPECGYLFPFGDTADGQGRGSHSVGVCPLCRHLKEAKPTEDANHLPFGGDRILVNKFAYEFSDPQRWDVIVFKNPGNPKQNYIKRLVGLPEETVQVYCGDIYIRGKDQETFEIARKPPPKIRRLLQPIHDTHYVPEEMMRAGWPQAWRPAVGVSAAPWRTSEDYRAYTLEEATDEAAWLYFENNLPSWWLDEPDLAAIEPQARLITDFSAYNGGVFRENRSVDPNGSHWVGDLAVDATVTLASSQGHLLLQLVEGGREFTCDIDVATGTAEITSPEGISFAGTDVRQLSADTGVTGPGTYVVSLANVDDQLVLWVDGDVVSFRGPGGQPHGGEYTAASGVRPHYESEERPGDLRPARVGARGMPLRVDRLQIHRDIYYIAVDDGSQAQMDYERQSAIPGQVFVNPATWSTTRLFDQRRKVQFELGEDQFFPMGDNSAVSQDARLWHGLARSNMLGPNNMPLTFHVDPWVERDRLIGKAFLVYFPHPWRFARLPIVPNFKRMGRIR